MKLQRIAATSLITAGLVLAAPPPAHSQPVTLRIADSLPTNFPMTNYSTGYFMAEMKKRIPDINFQHYPAEQLGKARDILSLTQSGVIDIGYIVPAYASDKIPLSAAAELPGSFKTNCEGTLAYWKLLKSGIIAREEMAPHGIKPLYAVLSNPYQVFTRAKQITRLEDLRGLKIRAASGGQAILVRKLGAAPINLPGSELHESLSRGTVDGALFPLAGIVGYDMTSIVKFMTVGQNFGDVATFHGISMKRWNELPAATRAAMEQVGDATTRHACEMQDKDNTSNLELVTKKNVKSTAFAPGEQARLDAMHEEVAQEWAQEMDKRGKSGSQTLKAFREALKSGS